MELRLLSDDWFVLPGAKTTINHIVVVIVIIPPSIFSAPHLTCGNEYKEIV